MTYRRWNVQVLRWGTLVAFLGMGAGCGESTGPGGGGPRILALGPNQVLPNSPGFDLVVHGTGFTAAAVVEWNGAPRTTTFVDASRLTAAIPGTDLSTADTAIVRVRDGGSLSPAARFAIAASAAPLTLISRTPAQGAEAGFDDAITAVFSAALDLSSVTDSSVALYDSGVAVPVTRSYDSLTHTVTLVAPLLPLHEYEVRGTDDIRSKVAGALSFPSTRNRVMLSPGTPMLEAMTRNP